MIFVVALNRALGFIEPMQASKFTKISEWIKAGNMASGFYLVGGNEVRQTEKAIGIPALKINSVGNLKPATCWLPKSHVAIVEDDFYDQKQAHNVLVPQWLYSAKMAEGFEF